MPTLTGVPELELLELVELELELELDPAALELEPGDELQAATASAIVAPAATPASARRPGRG